MKRTVLLILALCLCFSVFGGSVSAESAAAEMTAEELYLTGLDAYTAGDYEKAMEYFQKAADAGNVEGWRGLGNLYAQGLGVKEDSSRALEYYRLAAAQGDAKSYYNLAIMYESGEAMEKDIGKAVEYYEKSGSLGFSDAYATLASMYYHGGEVEQDRVRAVEYYRKAAELGNASSCWTMGRLYEKGETVEQDPVKAAEYYQKAADLGVFQAFCSLGIFYYRGTGVEQDYGRAVDCFTQAAEQDPLAMFMLGDCFWLGQGVEKDPAKAAECYRKALEAGYEPDADALDRLKAALGEAYPVFFPVPAEGTDYIVRTVGVLTVGDLTQEEQSGSMDLRFYTQAPHVPYYGLKSYVNFMYRTGLTVTPLQDGLWEVANPNGTKLLVNPSAGTIEAADWARFQIPPLPYRSQIGIKDSAGPWTYYSDVEFSGPPTAVTFDFAKYGISVYADAEDVYLPLSLLSVMFTDPAGNTVLWNGESVLKEVLSVDNITMMPVEWYASYPMCALLTGRKQRAQDIIREDYAELCFTLDYFFGYPGVGMLDRSIREKGLDAALEDTPELKSVKEQLKSPDMLEYMKALYNLFNIGLDDGHSLYLGLHAAALPDFPYPEIAQEMISCFFSANPGKSDALTEIGLGIKNVRESAWGDDVYRECGSTAILRIDSFDDDAAGWEAYYAGEGEIPMDAVGITWTGLKRASENPAIKNILLDLSANSGGSSDMLDYMIDLMFGDHTFRGYDMLSGQTEYAIFRSDKNLDGVFDEKDEEVKYDFNYAVLTTRSSFSCGNLMPILMQEHGAVLLGEPSGGGSCSVMMSTLTNGGKIMMSGWFWVFRDANGGSVEGGCRTDLPIARIEPETPTHANPALSNGDYSPYFDDVMLDRMINEWFEEKALSPAA